MRGRPVTDPQATTQSVGRFFTPQSGLSQGPNVLVEKLGGQQIKNNSIWPVGPAMGMNTPDQNGLFAVRKSPRRQQARDSEHCHVWANTAGAKILAAAELAKTPLPEPNDDGA